MTGKAENAAMTKVRALYGKRLREQDYQQLLQKQSVGEVARYLKNETDYGQDLAEIKEELVHRGQLEALVRRRSLRIYGKLLKYAAGEPLYLRLYIMQCEIEQILTAIRLLGSGQMDRFIVTLPVHMTRLFSYDLMAVAGIRSFSGLLEILHASPYGGVLGRFRLTGPEPVDITLCEAALLGRYYQAALEAVDKGYSGSTRRSLRELLLRQMTMHNVMVILRMRKYHGAPREEIEPRLVQVPGQRMPYLERLLDTPDLPSLQGALERIRPFRGIDFDGGAMELAGQMLRARRDGGQRLFRFSIQPVVVVICYMVLLEIEQDNIVHIIEGIRYQVPQEQLRGLLCI